MHYQPSRAQRELAESMDDAIAAILPIARWHSARNESEADWARLSELGIFDLARAEEAGGLGLGAVEEVLIAMALGRRLASPSIFATLAAVHARPTDEQWSGGRVAAAIRSADGAKVLCDGLAQSVLVGAPGEAAVYRLAAQQQELDDVPWLDRLSSIKSLGNPVGLFDDPGQRRVMLINAAALAGLADAAFMMAVEYSGIREQFGRPIGSFQAIKHHCANMALASRGALDLVTFAAVAIDDGRDDAAFLTDSAFVIAADAAIANAGRNVQIHGGIGFSAEADVHLFVKRAQVLVALGGGIEAAMDRLSVCSSDPTQASWMSNGDEA